MRIKFVLMFVPILLLLSGCSFLDRDRVLWNEGELNNIEFDRTNTPSEYELIVIHYILSNTPEYNIHKMRGESENVVYIKKDEEGTGCHEVVYDGNGDIVTNDYNQGSYNYYCYEDYPIKHFNEDILPWLLWGNTKDDPTSFDERMFYYTLDLDNGIQSYIFSDDFDHNLKIDFEELTDGEKMTYRFFNFLLFDSDYLIKLNEENLDELKEDSEFYVDYFNQIQEQLNVSNNNLK